VEHPSAFSARRVPEHQHQLATPRVRQQGLQGPRLRVTDTDHRSRAGAVGPREPCCCRDPVAPGGQPPRATRFSGWPLGRSPACAEFAGLRGTRSRARGGVDRPDRCPGPVSPVPIDALQNRRALFHAAQHRCEPVECLLSVWICRSSHQVAPASANGPTRSSALTASSPGVAPPRTISKGAAGRSARCSRRYATRSLTWPTGGTWPCLASTNSGTAPSQRAARRMGRRFGQ
jgi:hypothetical protein